MVDTGVLAEYIVRSSPHRVAVERLLEGSSRGLLDLYMTPITLSELFYVASRIYSAAGVEKSNEEALNFIGWLTKRIKVAEVDVETAFEAGELKKKFRISLPDCYVIAVAMKLQAKALFLKPEREMLSEIEELEAVVEFLAGSTR